MEKAKDLFYDIFGWDRTTGVPTRETLEKYDLAEWPMIWKSAASTPRTPQQLNKSHRKRNDRHVVWQT